ncbi:MAG: helix-turn-helix domain-containing protein [Oscillospiraceae bacterium]|jgi:transcriptional regulator with XRE-family HTH domain|nr:helix-turn-helix domain-containing protein [Oscillospiraceae bacterium]
MRFADDVKNTRKQMGLSQKDLAKILKVSYASINRWENGKTEPTKLVKSVFYEYCVAMDIHKK